MDRAASWEAALLAGATRWLDVCTRRCHLLMRGFCVFAPAFAVAGLLLGCAMLLAAREKRALQQRPAVTPVEKNKKEQ